MPPAFVLKNVSITIAVAPPGYTFRLQPDKHIHLAFLNDTLKRFSTPASSEVRDIFRILSEASRALSRQKFVEVFEHALPLLSAAAGVRLFPPTSGTSPDDETFQDEAFDYLMSLRTFVNDTLEVQLLAHGIDRGHIKEIKRQAKLHKIKRELRKFAKVTTSDERTIHCETSIKNPIDESYDQTGVTCILKRYVSDLSLAYFQPVRLVDRAALEIVGCLYVLKRPILGKMSLVLAGGGLRPAIRKTLDCRTFYRELVGELKRAVREMGLGGLYCAVGPPSGDAAYTLDGRTGQSEEEIQCLIPQNPTVIELPPGEHIYFPTDFENGPIAHVVEQ